MQELERRVLMAAAMDDLKKGPLAKVGTALAQAYNEYAAHISAGYSAASFHSSDRLLHSAADRVAIEIHASSNGAGLETSLRALGMSGEHRYGNAIEGWLPYAKINALAALKNLSFAQPIWYRTQSVLGQQDAAIRGNIERSTYGYTGAGVKVGVLSDSFDTGPGSYSADIASGDLPSGIQVIQDSPNGTDEGRAMCQLVYDTAPGVSLAFATAFEGGEAGFASNIEALRDAGCKVIVDDVMYFAEPMFQDGVIAQAVDDVVSSGVAYFSAAGNEGRQAYQSAFNPGISRADGSIKSQGLAPHFYGGLTHDFDPGPGVDDMQQFTLGAGQSITLSFQWDQPYGSVPGSASCASDLDIYVLNSAGTRVIGGSATANVGADPVEVFSFTNNGALTTTYKLMICKHSGVTPDVIKYVNFDTQSFTEYNTNSGAVYGHPNAAGAAAVGAAAWYNTPAYGVNPPVIESYSSRGGTPILFSTSGVPLGSAINRQRLLFTAPDGGNTSFFYSDSSSDPDSLPNFFGTSAAAPAAGAVAAMLLQARPSLTPTQIYSTLENTALDMDDPFTGGFDVGVDDATGYGLIRADAAIASVVTGSVAGTAFQDTNADGSLNGGEPDVAGATVFDDANNNGSLDGGELSTTTAGDGSFTLSSLAIGAHTLREIAPAGFFATASPMIVNVTGPMTGTNFANIAATYIGTNGNDQYLLRRKSGDTNYEILISGSLACALPPIPMPPLTFNLLGGNDTFTLDLTNGPAIPGGGVNLDAGGGNDSLAVLGSTGPDAVNFNAASVVIGGATLSHASVDSITFSGEGGGDALTLNSGASVLVGAGPQKLQSLSIAAGAALTLPAGGASTLYATSLALAGRLDLNDNDLVVENAAFTDIRALVVAGYSSTPDPTRNGIVSSTGQSSGNTILALFDNALVGLGSWNGQPISASAIVGKYTYFGDMDLDGQVTAGDYGVLDANLGSTPPPGTAWLSGDADLDGIITSGDYGILDANLGAGVGAAL